MIVSVVALLGGIPVEMVSLFLTLIQTLIAMMDCEGGNFMTNRLLVECGTHGVVQFLGEYRCCYKCRVGSNPARSAIREAIFGWPLLFTVPAVPIPCGDLRVAGLAEGHEIGLIMCAATR